MQYTATFPPELNTVYLVNSGSEANELALRIARTHVSCHIATSTSSIRNSESIIVLDGWHVILNEYHMYLPLTCVYCGIGAYHGNTAALIDISPHKWAQAIDGKIYQKNHVYVVACPDSHCGSCH